MGLSTAQPNQWSCRNSQRHFVGWFTTSEPLELCSSFSEDLNLEPAAQAGWLLGGAIVGLEIWLVSVQPVVETALAQWLHLSAAKGRSSERHCGQVLVSAGGPKTVLPRRFMYARYGTTRTK